MDVFSAGCAIAELFLEAPIFSLSQLYKYRKGEYDPSHAHLSKIEDKDIRELVSHMIQVDPESRYTAEEYLNFWRRKAFPEYFYSFLHQYMGLITDPLSGRAAIISVASNFGEADDRIDRVFFDFDKISYFLGYETGRIMEGRRGFSHTFANTLLPVNLAIPNNHHQSSVMVNHPVDDGTLIFLTLIVSSLRNTARATAKIRACDILLAFAERTTDEAKLDRILPYVMALLNDPADIVKVAALRTLTQLVGLTLPEKCMQLTLQMALVNVVSPVNAYVFPEYILPRLQQSLMSSSSKPKAIVRATYAACLASLARTSLRFLDMVQALRADGSLPTADPEADDGLTTESPYQNLYDIARLDLVDFFETHTKALLTDSDASVRRAFLGSVSSLCVFFGSAKANDVVLSHLNTYLNDKDWLLKCAFFETIVGVATFVGATSLEEFILPLMVQALTDPEEFVMERVLTSFANMAELGLFQRSKIWELIDVVGRFTMHPNLWIREASAHFVSSATKFLSSADNHCIIIPLIRPYIKTSLTDFEEVRILDALKKPLPRAVLDMAVGWARTAEKGIFWKPVQQQRTFSFGSGQDTIPTISSLELGPNALSRVPKNEEDEHWLSRLRNLGMGTDDEWKLLALREYIWRMAPKKMREQSDREVSQLNNVIVLKDLNVTPKTIFFDEKQPLDTRSNSSQGAIHGEGVGKHPHTIADALLDASTTIDDTLARHRKLNMNSRRDAESDHSSPTRLPLIPAGASRASPQLTSPISVPPSTRNQSHISAGLNSDTEARRKLLNVPNPSTNGGFYRAGSPTSTESPRDGRSEDGDRVGRTRSSAMNLLTRRDTFKSVAETGTTSTTAFGKVDGPFPRHSLAASPLAMTSKEDTARHVPQPQLQPSHTYDGNDPHVLQLLDSLYIENYPTDLIDFGPMVLPINRRQPIRKSSGQEVDKPWRPEGTLVATFGEHTGAINRVVISPDHKFFLTASDDSTVKVWDGARLEKNLAHRSRQTHSHFNGAKVKCITFVENTHTFLSAATDGSVHAVKVDVATIGGTTKYGKLRLLRSYQLPEGEYAIWCEHFRADNHSILLMATNASRIHALDLRTMLILYTLENPIHHGTPTCFCLDKKHTWLLVGTSHGVLDLWDLRFRLRLKAWGLSGATPIHRLHIHPLKGKGRWVCVAGGTGQNEITVWDIVNVECKEVYRAGGNKDGFKSYEPWKVDEEKPEGMLGRFATALDPTGTGGVDRGMRALVVGLDAPEDGRETKYGFFITGGSDQKIRFWDVTRVEASMVISGLDAEEGKPSFTSSQIPPSITLNTERLPQPGPTAPNAGPGNRTPSNTSVKRRSGRPPRSTVISMQQQQLLKNHLDLILDVALLEVPYGMTISVDRSGVIYVFQ